MRPSPTTPRFLPTEARPAHAVSMALLMFVGAIQYAAGIIETLLVHSLVLLGIYLVGGTVPVAFGCWLWYLVAAGYTEVSPAALVTRQTRTRIIEWHTIADIQPERRGRYWRVRVHRRTGRSLLLIAPLTRVSRPNPRFGAELETMRTWWRAATGLGMSRSWPPAG